MEITLQTPALLFPALSLLMLGYTNKFLAIANLIRRLIADYELREDPSLLDQIYSLRRRVMLIRWMQATGILSILFCVVTMFAIYIGHQGWVKLMFAASLILMIVSLGFSLVEIFFSAGALRVLLKKFEAENTRKNELKD